MHDYQLERLNTRSFEQLIQALGTEIIGPQLMIFGDGPDGGREATFNGAIKYPPTEKSWSGYGIVQAKFRQQPDSAAKKNVDWAIQQLKSEFAKLKPRPKCKKTSRSDDRVCPEYYIFATNLTLSPVARKGGADADLLVLATARPQGYSDEFDPSLYRHLPRHESSRMRRSECRTHYELAPGAIVDIELSA
jgi:hypothetical protein